MTNDVLTIRGASKYRSKQRVLHKINLSVRSGERVALLGHNGAGKSTLIKLILGLTPLSEGKISIGTSRPGGAAARRDVAFLPESVNFHPNLSGHEQLTLFARLAGCGVRNIERLLDRVGLAEASQNQIGTYSKGMRQRLGLAQVLLGRPKLALLDEPTSGLDPISRLDLYKIIDELAGQGCAVLIASHALTEVEAQTDRIAILQKGVKVADDTLANLSRKAGLRTKLRITASNGQAGQIAALTNGNRVNGATVEIEISPDQKMIKLRQIAGMGNLVADFEMLPPRLEDLYRHYAKGEQA